jgi:hypothetical protein
VQAQGYFTQQMSFFLVPRNKSHKNYVIIIIMTSTLPDDLKVMLAHWAAYNKHECLFQGHIYIYLKDCRFLN